MPAQKFYEGQEIPPLDPNSGKPVLVYHAGRFYPKDAAGAVTGMPAVKLQADDTAPLAEMAKDAMHKQFVAQRSKEFMARQGQGPAAVATGPIYGDIPLVNHVIPNIGRAFQTVRAGLGGGGDAPQLGKLDAINQATWAAIRPVGAGPIRSFEAEGWKKAFPNSANWGTVNKDIADRNVADAAEAARQLRFVQQFVHAGKGSFGEGMAQYAASQATPAPAATPAAAPAPTAAPASSQGKLNPEQYQAYLRQKYAQ